MLITFLIGTNIYRAKTDSVTDPVALQPTMIFLLPDTPLGMVTDMLYEVVTPAAMEELTWSASCISVGEPSKMPLLLLSNQIAELLEPAVAVPWFFKE